MPKKSAPASLPLTFDLPASLHESLVALQAKTGAQSLSVLVRHIVESADLDSLKPDLTDHRQVSVRIPKDLRSRLTKAARHKKISTGELMRLAIAAYKAPSKRR